ncbi:MAG: GNAT family N-acetyltransferase [Spirochaetaceae bacterium]|jgi:GNAT superfamily N-acetyltransferase|nr:GNAT family N-acetyltransferase [Spirochaetaceae bacterium]
MTDKISIREAVIEDAASLLEFIHALAEYEHLEDQVEATVEGLRRTIFIDKRAEVLIAEYAGQAAGFALFFHNYSTFKGKPGIYLEDLFVKPELRGNGIGRALLQKLAGIAARRGCGRLEWACLDWNAPSIAFYRGVGASPLSDWTIYRVTEDKFMKLGKSIGNPPALPGDSKSLTFPGI